MNISIVQEDWTGQLSAVKELISTGENFPERLDLAKMMRCVESFRW